MPAETPSECGPAPTGSPRASLRRAVARFAAPSARQAAWQIANSFGPLLVVVGAMYATVHLSLALTLALAVLAAGFVVRVFIIQHDCGHGAFTASNRANAAIGWICSVVTLTPYANWRRQHAGHHGTWNDLDRRWSGADIYSTCLTIDEYRALSPSARRQHRLLQHPVVALLLLPPIVFLVLFRLPLDAPADWASERRQVHLTNLVIAAVFGGLILAFGWRAVLLVQLPVSVTASVFGVWLFSLQHRFEHTLWSRHDAWSHADAALHGSSYLRLPRVLQWFTGNIGFHHIHHLNSRVPNYRLQACYEAVEGVRAVPSLTVREGLRAFQFGLWDEQAGRMVRFGTVERALRQPREVVQVGAAAAEQAVAPA